jgi:cyclopropane fatty-acyl-phospholipid synthase-like methyltransferase
MKPDSKTPALENVRNFYQTLPFNYYENATNALENIKRNPIRSYPDLDELLLEQETRRVLELGCGAGWASNSLALHYGCDITAIDFTDTAIDRAKEVSRLLGTDENVQFLCQDLYELAPDPAYDLVFSVGVLHHTNDCKAGVRHAAQFIGPGGVLYLGLYHSYGRRFFLDHYQEIAKTRGEEEAFQEFCKTLNHQPDRTHAQSWFRDQVLHPFETQHSFAEVYGWLKELELDVISTSINGFEPLEDVEAVMELEKSFGDVSKRRNIDEGRFYPGFFTVMAERSA